MIHAILCYLLLIAITVLLAYEELHSDVPTMADGIKGHNHV